MLRGLDKLHPSLGGTHREEAVECRTGIRRPSFLRWPVQRCSCGQRYHRISCCEPPENLYEYGHTSKGHLAVVPEVDSTCFRRGFPCDLRGPWQTCPAVCSTSRKR